MLTFTEALLL